MSFKESILIPKAVFLDLKEKLEKGEVGGGEEKKKKKKSTPKKKKAKTTEENKKKKKSKISDADLIKYYRKLNKGDKIESKKDATEFLSVFKPEYEILKNFPKEEHHVIFRIMKIVWENSDIIKYNPKSFEVTIHGFFYSNSHLIEILSYLIGMSQERYLTSRRVYSTHLNIIVPEASYPFIKALANILRIDVLDIDQYILGIDKIRKENILRAENRISYDSRWAKLTGRKTHPDLNLSKFYHPSELITPTSQEYLSSSKRRRRRNLLSSSFKKNLYKEEDFQEDESAENDDSSNEEDSEVEEEEEEEEEKEEDEEEEERGEDGDFFTPATAAAVRNEGKNIYEQIEDESQKQRKSERQRKKPEKYSPSTYK